ncbi:PREDICTED: E3 ubiquitin/ISG15 ligase TRIM25-like [Nanorana parkeri]|uniref:E3 ubiquitin/ISG15 ligase TRIM25-like n=1 Tax=Nanorana parkeri TaxID=125878 RepID=UPI0008545DC3|nr:PREDICTED: E3 ubiquitin/ISG15 ligase TRIM25-like [Nanorana parkeri]
MASADLRSEPICSICLMVYRDPATLRCGHNFCRVCIDDVLDTQEASGVYTCPECREEFYEGQDSIKYTTLPNISEGPLSVNPDQENTVSFCTYCIHSSIPAVKLCLLCESFLCDGHLRVHSKSAEHVLTDISACLDNRKCPFHNEMLRYVCCEDSTCICVSCLAFGDHRGHQVALLDDAFEKKKEKLRTVLEILTSKTEEDEKVIESLQKLRSEVPEKASGVTERVTCLFVDIRRQLEDLEKRVLGEISRQEEKISLSISDLIQRLEVKKDALARKLHHIEELCNTTDPMTLLQDKESESEDFGAAERNDNVDTEDENDKLHEIGELDEGLISETLYTGIVDIITYVKNFCPLGNDSTVLLDINTAGAKIIVSEDLKTATWSAVNQNRSETPARFQYNQVLTTRNFSSGQHSWDVETSESGNWRLGMTYSSMERRGQRSVIGDNNKSWCLRRCNNQCSVIHDSKDIVLSDKFSSQRFRIYLDYPGGCLSFYELCEPVRHLHTFNATFNEPLHLAFLLSNAWVRISSRNFWTIS